MSILDEAIKEHLELKRKRGAGTEEIDRLEREAFGDAPAPPPVQPAPVEDRVSADERDAEQETLPHEPVQESFAEEEPYESAPPAGETPEPAPSEAESEWEEQQWEQSEEHPTEDVPLGNFAVGGKARFETDEEEIAPLAPPTPSEREPAPHPPDERAEGAHDHEGEELLEETPEFLRDSPGDDKLWFEQRPPKDFDFGDD